MTRPLGGYTHTSDGPISASTSVDPAGPWKPDLPTTVALVNAGVIPRLQVLLYNMFSVVDASLPNKDQNRAVRKLIQSAFDEAYFGIIRVAYPDSNFESGPGPAISPQPYMQPSISQNLAKAQIFLAVKTETVVEWKCGNGAREARVAHNHDIV